MKELVKQHMVSTNQFHIENEQQSASKSGSPVSGSGCYPGDSHSPPNSCCPKTCHNAAGDQRVDCNSHAGQTCRVSAQNDAVCKTDKRKAKLIAGPLILEPPVAGCKCSACRRINKRELRDRRNSCHSNSDDNSSGSSREKGRKIGKLTVSAKTTDGKSGIRKAAASTEKCVR